MPPQPSPLGATRPAFASIIVFIAAFASAAATTAATSEAAAPTASAATPATHTFAFEEAADHTSLALRNVATNRIVWRAVCDPAQPKPYIYPLATLEGIELTANAPADHLWHHSLWFCWKYINGVNYWEPNKKTGWPDGRTRIRERSFKVNADRSAHVELALEYGPTSGEVLLTEKRRLSFSSPNEDGSYTIDWDAAFTVGAQALVFERTPPKAASGGYAGLSLRFPKGTKGWSFLTSTGVKSAADGNGRSAQWVDFSGPAGGTRAGIAVFDHPSNPRHPTAWYLNESHPYFSPALIYHSGLQMPAGAAFRLRYRILVHRGDGEAAVLQRAWAAYAR